jgi:hypothetical protein
MTPKETTILPFLLGLILIIALVVFLSLLDHAVAAVGLNPANSALALFSFLVF